MRSIITLTMGFLMARYIYLNVDKKVARQKEAQIRESLENVLEKVGLSKKEAQSQSEDILNTP